MSSDRDPPFFTSTLPNFSLLQARLLAEQELREAEVISLIEERRKRRGLRAGLPVPVPVTPPSSRAWFEGTDGDA